MILFAIPALFDSTEASLKNIATTMIAGSVIHMLRSTVFVYCAIFALIFLKKKLYRHHWTSMVVIIIGIVLVGVGYLIEKPSS